MHVLHIFIFEKTQKALQLDALIEKEVMHKPKEGQNPKSQRYPKYM